MYPRRGSPPNNNINDRVVADLALLLTLTFMGAPQSGSQLLWGEEEQRNDRDLPLAAGRGMCSLRRRGAIKAFKEVNYESKAVREAHVREVQDHQAQGQGHGYLRKPQA